MFDEARVSQEDAEVYLMELRLIILELVDRSNWQKTVGQVLTCLQQHVQSSER